MVNKDEYKYNIIIITYGTANMYSKTKISNIRSSVFKWVYTSLIDIFQFVQWQQTTPSVKKILSIPLFLPQNPY